MAFALPFTGMAAWVMGLPNVYRATAILIMEETEAQNPAGARAPAELEARLDARGRTSLTDERLGEMLRRFGLYPEWRERTSPVEAITRFRRDIHVEPKESAPGWPGRSVVFAVSYHGRDARTVAWVTNRLASFYLAENATIAPVTTPGSFERLRDQLTDARKRLDGQRAQLDAARRRSLSQPPRDARAARATLDSLSSQLALNDATRLRIQEAREAVAKQLAQAEAVALAALKESLLVRRRQELATLRGIHTDRWPEVIRIRREITNLEQSLAERAAVTESIVGPQQPTVSADVARLRGALRSADAELGRLQDEAERLRRSIDIGSAPPRILDRPTEEVRHLELEYEQAASHYEALLTRLDEAALAARSEPPAAGERFRVLTAAAVPAVPVAPDRLPLLLIAVTVGAGLAGIVMAIVKGFDTSFHSAAELRRVTGVPVVVSIPRAMTRSARRRRHLQAWTLALGVIATMVALGVGSYVLGQSGGEVVHLLTRGGV